MTLPALVGISHGTASLDGQAAVSALMVAVAAARPELDTRLGHVDVQQPDVAATLDTLPPDGAAVIVPLLLSTGYHVHVDLAEAAAASDRDVTVTAALGPHPLLVELLVRRGGDLDPAALLVLVAAGSSDAGAVDDCRTMGRMLGERLGREVTVAFLSAAEPRLTEHVAELRLRHPTAPVVVLSYLLAPGYFQTLAEGCGADRVTSPLLSVEEPAPAEVVAVVFERFSSAL